jgi:hypothetical protein
MALEWRRRPILTAADDKVGRGQRLELHGEEGNLISGSRESRSSPGDQSMMATIRVRGSAVMSRYGGRGGRLRVTEQLGVTTELEVASPVVDGGRRCEVDGVVPSRPGGRRRLLFGDWSWVRGLGDGSVVHERQSRRLEARWSGDGNLTWGCAGHDIGNGKWRWAGHGSRAVECFSCWNGGRIRPRRTWNGGFGGDSIARGGGRGLCQHGVTTCVGARWPGHTVMGRRGPLASGPSHLNFSLNFEISTNFEIQNEGLPDIQNY